MGLEGKVRAGTLWGVGLLAAARTAGREVGWVVPGLEVGWEVCAQAPGIESRKPTTKPTAHSVGNPRVGNALMPFNLPIKALLILEKMYS